MFTRSLAAGFACALACFAVAMAPVQATAADIKLLGGASMRVLLPELVAQFEKSSGHKVTVEYGTLGAITDRVMKGEAADAVIVTPAQNEKLEKEGKLVAGSRAGLARVGYGVFVKAGGHSKGLWVAPWLADVALLGRTEIVHHLFIMAVSPCAGALLIGIVSQAARSLGIGPASLFGAIASVFIAAELALVCRLPLPSEAICAVLAAMGGATVLSYALLTDLFPREIRGRANAALNVLHIGVTFANQTAIGLIVSLWERDGDGHYPAPAYQIAFFTIVVLQLAALLWFLRPRSAPVSTGIAAHPRP